MISDTLLLCSLLEAVRLRKIYYIFRQSIDNIHYVNRFGASVLFMIRLMFYYTK